MQQRCGWTRLLVSEARAHVTTSNACHGTCYENVTEPNEYVTALTYESNPFHTLRELTHVTRYEN